VYRAPPNQGVRTAEADAALDEVLSELGLASVDLANQNGTASREMDDHAAAYRQGYRDCLQAVAVAFGIVVPVSEDGNMATGYQRG